MATRRRTTGSLLLAFLAALLLACSAAPGAVDRAAASPFAKPGMWIWYVDSSQGGSIDRIIRRARASGIGTLYIKSADGTGTWSQFTKSLNRKLNRAGIKVCGWQYVYGRQPVAEARAAAAAKSQGADCFVIDAEAEYEGNYAGADRYVRKLRNLVGGRFPIGLSSFPYVHYHPAFPYSVFMGPGAATANLPQIYWYTIGDTVGESVGITWYQNRLYDRPILPVGQTYENPPVGQLVRFRQMMLAYGAAPSWWSWQETERAEWDALGRAIDSPPVGYRPVTEHATMRSGSRGDQVVWLQQHLIGAGFRVPVSGIYGKKTRAAVVDFQESRGLAADGVAGSTTWRRLLKVRPVRVLWSKPRSRSNLRSLGPGSRAPLSASLPPVRNELAP